MVCGAVGPKLEGITIQTLGLGKTMLENPRVGGQIWKMLLPGNSGWAQELVTEAFRTRPAAEWVRLLDDLGVPCGLLDDRDEWLDHPQVVATGMRAEVDDPERGHVVMPGIMINLTASPGSLRGPAPRVGEHNDTAPTWMPQPAAAPLPSMRPGPLAGYTILNVGSFIATPYAGSLLAELGANVIKVEPPAGDQFRFMGWSANRGLHSLALELHTPDGVAAFHDLVRHADAVVDGLRPGTTARLGIDYDSLAKVNDDIITLSLSGYGEGGPISHKGSVDTVLTGISGMMSAQGGAGQPVNNTVAVVDATTGAVSALAVVLALLHRLRTGQGQRVWDSLLGTVTYLQSGEIVRHEGRPSSRTGGDDFKGSTAFDRLYATAGGWIRLQAPPGAGTEGALEQALGVGISGRSDEAATEMIAKAFGALPREQAITSLNQAGLPAVPALKVSETIRDPRLVESEFVHLGDGSDDSVICDTGRHALFSRTPRTGIKLLPGVGEHTKEILSAAGLPGSAISALIDAGTAVQGGPMTSTAVISYR
jgi:crotonobetainyl-CoA:carnitine CoA-transferase CaiB-like acyl-CoA transferase